MRKRIFGLSVSVVVILLACSLTWASNLEGTLKRWSKAEVYKDSFSGELEIRATYFAGEYIEALVQQQAEENLWTSSEMEDYKYTFLKSLQLDDTIPVFLRFKVIGPSIHMAPFGDQVVLWVGKNKLKPVDYDRRFNFGISEFQEGFVYFPKYDPDTGKNYLDGIKSVRLVINGSISAMTEGKTVQFIWDVNRDDPDSLWQGKAAERFEADRLIKRLQKLNAEKTELQSKLQENSDEIYKIEQRLKEIQSQ